MEGYSNKDYKRLGDRIRSNPKEVADADLLMLQERIESIISKLLRFPEMQVNRAEDIAGCRCIMSSTEKAYELYDRLMRNQNRLPFVIKGTIHDYIKEPKESGNAVLKDGDNRRIEIQIRALEHHNWATLVEITDLLFDAKLKEHGRKSNPDLYEFHRLLSLPPERLTKDDRYFMADVAIKYNYIGKIGEVFARNYLDVRRQWNKMKLQHSHFFLVSIGSDGIPDFMGFSIFEEAEKAYFDKFVNNDENRNIVLTHLEQANFTKISIAYSNYFMTFNNTIVQVLLNLSEAVVNAYRQNKVKLFDKYYQSYLDLIEFWVDQQVLELSWFKSDKIATNSRLMRTEWTNSINSAIDVMQHMRWKMKQELTFNPLHIIPYMHKQRMRKHFIWRITERVPMAAEFL